ncbi:hypothetical protein B0J11DRAFT_585308 [Dendryphion nanum]|uniref:Galactosyl transferase GMA12/MNN10 family protein n=1 Tax=Dendryphion nanum TaxID=256645 RepID=A0A9P9I9K5_9PLEO|nr:hypothetical protein B0J11DRAFT_585308 [Dendryphion nanum]
MGHYQYGQPSPTLGGARRRVPKYSPRMTRYVVIAVVSIIVIMLWKRETWTPTVSKILPAETHDKLSNHKLYESHDPNEPSEDNQPPHRLHAHPGAPQASPSSTPSSPETTPEVKYPESTDTEKHNSEEETPQQSAPSISPESTPSQPSPTSYPRFGKVTASFGDPDPPYENAIASHNLHNELQGYPHFILREHMIRGLWSKHGWIMTIIGQELAKPEDQRLKWLLWHDRDTVLMNPQIPLDIFVPPEPQFSNIHMLVTNDRNGLNNGVFLVRVNQWAFKLFASALSIREYQPDIPLKYTEQSGMEEAIKRPWWANSVAYVPQRWFNGFPSQDDVSKSKPKYARPGSLLIHFASNRDGLRPERMAHYGEIAKSRAPEWDRPVNETGYEAEIREYWERLGKGESMEGIVNDIGRRTWD